MATCTHLDMIEEVEPDTDGCQECLADGGRWVHPRICLTCGHVGCCDSSANQHARAHYQAEDHPLVRSLEEGEEWVWCFEDEVYLEEA